MTYRVRGRWKVSQLRDMAWWQRIHEADLRDGFHDDEDGEAYVDLTVPDRLEGWE